MLFQDGAPRELFDALMGKGAKRLVIHFLRGKAHHQEVGGQGGVQAQVVYGGQQLAPGQIAGAAEDDYRAGLRQGLLGQADREGVRGFARLHEAGSPGLIVGGGALFFAMAAELVAHGR